MGAGGINFGEVDSTQFNDLSISGLCLASHLCGQRQSGRQKASIRVRV